MNVYDFDNTVFRTDSSVAFCMYCLRRYPRLMLRDVSGIFPPLISYRAGKTSDASLLKEKVFSFLRYLPDVDQTVADFWRKNLSGIQPWYLEQKRSDDVIISASPEFLLKSVVEDHLGVHLIATKMDRYTGAVLGMNCHDRQKVIRFREEYPWASVDAFYSDSLSDSPMAEIADQAYLVQKDGLIPWLQNSSASTF